MNKGTRIYVLPDEVWNYVTDHKWYIAANIVVIAEKDDTEILLEIVKNVPCLSAVVNGIEEESVEIEADDAESVCRDFYDMYLFDEEEEETVDATESEEVFDDSILQEEIDNREEELEYAFEDFAKTVGSGYYGLKLDDADALKEEVLEVFAKYIRVYRPGWYTDENDEDVFIEYPYEADDDSANNTETTPANRVEI